MVHRSARWIHLSLLLFSWALVTIAQQYSGPDIAVNGRLVPAPQNFADSMWTCSNGTRHGHPRGGPVQISAYLFWKMNWRGRNGLM
jgi:hypothetical protein